MPRCGRVCVVSPLSFLTPLCRIVFLLYCSVPGRNNSISRYGSSFCWTFVPFLQTYLHFGSTWLIMSIAPTFVTLYRSGASYRTSRFENSRGHRSRLLPVPSWSTRRYRCRAWTSSDGGLHRRDIVVDHAPSSSREKLNKR